MTQGKHTSFTQGSPLCRGTDALTRLKESGQKCLDAYQSTVLFGINGGHMSGEENIIALNGKIKQIQTTQLEFPWYQTFQLELPKYVGLRKGEEIAQDILKRLGDHEIKSDCDERKITFILDGNRQKNMANLIAAQDERAKALIRSNPR